MTGVRRSTAADVAPIAATLAAAFDGYAWGRWTVPEPGRRGRLEQMFRVSMARVTIPYLEVLGTRPDRQSRGLGSAEPD
jgi:hypothetical protein